MQYKIEMYENILDIAPKGIAFADNELEAEATIRNLKEKYDNEPPSSI